MRTGAAGAVGARCPNENDVTMTTAGLWRYGNWQHMATGCTALVMACPINIFLPCGFFFLLSFFSSPNLSSRRLDVYHTSKHGVTVWPLCEFRMQVWNVLHAARWKYRMPKNRHLRTIVLLCRAISSQLRHISTIGKKFLSSNISSIRLRNNRFRVFAALLHGTPVVGVSQTGAFNRGRHSARWPSRWALAHILVWL